MFKCIRAIIEAFCSFRGTAKCFEIFMPGMDAYPSYTILRNWLYKTGLYLLSRPVPARNDWVFILDHTIDFGDGKLFLLLAVSQETLEKKGHYMPSHCDMHILDIELCKTSNGEVIFRKLTEASERIGKPVQLLGDGGSDIQKGFRLYVEKNPEVKPVYDVTHKSALILKSELALDDSWQEFSRLCSSIKTNTFQTPLAFASPPRPAEKSKEMNFGRYTGWASTILELMDKEEMHELSGNGFRIGKELLNMAEAKGVASLSSLLAPLKGDYATESELLGAVNREFDSLPEESRRTLEQLMVECGHTGRQVLGKHFGRLKAYGPHLKKWVSMATAIKTLNCELKKNGISNESIAICRRKINGFQVPKGSSVKKKIFDYLDELEQGLEKHRYLASSDIIESIFGKLKKFIYRTPFGEIGKNLLLVPLFVTELSADLVHQALESIRTVELQAWFAENIGQSGFSKRKQALSLLS